MTVESDVDPHISRAFVAFNEHDVDAFAAEFAADGTFRDPMQDGELTRDELKTYFSELYAGFSDARIETRRSLPSAAGAAVEWTFHGTHDGAFEDIPPTGESVAVPGVSVVSVSDDGATSWRDYWDRQTFLEQLGLA